MSDPLHPKTAAEAAEAFMRNVPTGDPKMPEPVAYLYHDADKPENAHPLFHSTMLVMPFGRREGCRNETPLITIESAQAYAEALAEARVAQERERWTDAVMSELDSNGQAEAIVRCVTGQPPETGK